MSRSIKAERPPALPPPLYRPVGIASLLSALVVAVLAALYSGDPTAGQLDQSLRSAVETALPPAGMVALVIDFVAEPLHCKGCRASSS